MRLQLDRHVRIVVARRSLLLLCALTACGSDLKRSTRAFVASTTCGQGPYDIHLRADGTTGEEGLEIIACVPRRISGHVRFKAGQLELANHAFGDGADNQRCVGGPPAIVTTAAAGDGGRAGGEGTAAGRTAGPAPTLVERPFTGSEAAYSDELCGRLGLTAQEVLIPTVLLRTGPDELPAGTDLHVRLWSDAPNDLEGVVFLIRHLTSKKSVREVHDEVAARDRKRDRTRDRDAPREAAAPAARPASHGPPPAPLLEERPPRAIETARWIPGYWSWTGAEWGWIAGFWRDERVAMPPPRVEVPGAPPRPHAVWVGGTWTLRAGQYVWITGRWRR